MTYRQITLCAMLLTMSLDLAHAYDLGQHAWRHRLLVLVAPDNEDSQLASQNRRIEQRRDALMDRDMRVLRLLAESAYMEGRPLETASVRQLREALNITADDRVLILIGKDGGIKRRAPLDTDLRELFAQIDGMPMRQEEIQNKKRRGIEVTIP